MNDNRSLQAAMWILVIAQTVTAIDMPGKGPRKLPAPRAYIAVLALWSILSLVADAGYERAAAVAGWITTLTAVFGHMTGNTFVPGAAGAALSKLVNGITGQFVNASSASTTTQSGTVSA